MRKTLVRTVSALESAAGLPGMVVSTADVDRDGDRVYPENLSLVNFANNGPLLWSHKYDQLPIGAVTDLEVVPGRALKAWWRWLEGDEFADRVKRAWNQGIVRAASIGFRVDRSRPNDYGGVDVLAGELLEVSLTPLPAQPSAVRTMKALGLLSDLIEVPVDRAEFKRMVKEIWDRELTAATRRELFRQLRAVAPAVAEVLDPTVIELADDPAAVRTARSSVRW